MRLSESIRKGSKGTFQTIGYLERYGKTCALGAAMGAVEPKAFQSVWSGTKAFLKIAWMTLFLPRPKCCPADVNCRPKYLKTRGVLSSVIHLNDEHRWSRERIADWIEQGEVCMEKQKIEEGENK